MLKKVFWLSLVALFFAPLVQADVHVNGATGTDSPTCGAIGSPCKTVGQGVTNAGGGTNVVKIAAGEYSEDFFISTSGVDLTLQGGWNADFSAHNCNPDHTLIHPSVDLVAPLRIKADTAEDIAVSLSCLTFQGTGDTSSEGIRLQALGGTVRANMTQSVIDGFAGSGIYVYGNTPGSLDLTIDKTVFKNAYQTVTWPTSGGGIHAYSFGGATLTITLENCLLFNNEATQGGALHIDSHGDGSTTTASLTNVTVSDNRSTSEPSGGIRIESAALGQVAVTLTNTIFWGNTYQGEAEDIWLVQLAGGSSTLNARYSIIGELNNSGGTYNDNGGNLNLEPLLDSTYHLLSGSPAIDAGLCGIDFLGSYRRIAPYDDIDGDPRPGLGELTGCDIGADEYTGNLLYFPVKSKNGKVTIICM